MSLPLHKLVMIIALTAFTLVTVWTDVRSRRICNWATLPMWGLGWVYQAVWFQEPGLLNGALGTLVATGLFFPLWTLRIAGGGDVKLMAALGVWLGLLLTTRVILASLAFVLIYQCGLFASRRRATHSTVAPHADSASRDASGAQQVRSSGDRRQAFAPAVAAGTWTVLLLGWRLW